MNIGQLSVLIGFLSSLAATYFFYIDGKRKSPGISSSQSSKNSYSQRLYFIVVVASVLASITLFYHFLNHQYQYAYVAHFSANSSPLLYLISAFWAGQEGTFLLWVLLVVVMGLVFMKSSKSEDPYAMAIVSAYSAFLFLLMLVKSPFEVTPTVPADGTGLNPLLQDPWMAIHPPILFMGYAATVFPFALAVSALARRKYDHWFSSGFTWTLFASVTLGAGIIIGGFWAYEVLGWGGYWGWDPVENSSLVPWLILLALIHGLIVQRAKGSLMRTNIFLALLSFILVLYATFLTRSGVLADFSVHSFVDLGINNYLVGGLVVGVVLGFGLFVTRFREIKAPKIDISSINRELTLVLSLYVLCAAALFTFVGMSSPILTGIIGKASQVDTSFYNKVNMPVALGIALLLGITPFLGWTEEKRIAILLKRLSMPFALMLLSCAIAYVAGVNSIMLLIFVGTAAFGLISNAIIAFRQYRSGWMNISGPIAHIGVALLLIGIVGSGVFDETRQLVLKTGQPQSVYGHQFTFKGIADTRAVKPLINIEVSDGKTSYIATPKLYFSEFTQSLMREPDIKIYPLSDLYISPIEMKHSESEHNHNSMYELTKGETKDVGGYKVTFARFDMSEHGQPGSMAVGAVLNVNIDGKDHEVIPQLMFDQHGERTVVPATMPAIGKSSYGTVQPQVSLNAISVEEKKVMLELLSVNDLTAQGDTQELVVEISTKPLMMVVWTGVVLIILGSAIAFQRHRSKVPSVV
jgi:cytochrome c-type biogenesis protein CcmF